MSIASSKAATRYRESAEIEPFATSIGDIYIGAEPRRRQHYQGVCTEVIEDDCYGLRQFHADGFQPKVIVDMGGHIGTFSLHSHHFWPDADIYIFEVMRDEHICGPFASAIARSLDKNIEGIENIHLFRSAIIGYYGQEDADIVTWEDFGKQKPALEDRLRNHTHRWAKAMSVRDLLEATGILSIDLLKMDIECSEVNVLRECAELGLLENIQYITGEWHFALAREEIERILSPTHDVSIQWNGPNDEWNTFTAQHK